MTVRARLGHLSTTWSLAPRLAATDEVLFSLAVPATARLHASADDYVTDLLAIVEVDGAQSIRTGFLAWPDGPTGVPVVWTAEERVLFAPQGVLQASLRDPSLSDDDRLMPELADVAPPPTRRADVAMQEVEP